MLSRASNEIVRNWAKTAKAAQNKIRASEKRRGRETKAFPAENLLWYTFISQSRQIQPHHRLGSSLLCTWTRAALGKGKNRAEKVFWLCGGWCGRKALLGQQRGEYISAKPAHRNGTACGRTPVSYQFHRFHAAAESSICARSAVRVDIMYFRSLWRWWYVSARWWNNHPPEIDSHRPVVIGPRSAIEFSLPHDTAFPRETLLKANTPLAVMISVGTRMY